jgi:hypothetical protein
MITSLVVLQSMTTRRWWRAVFGERSRNVARCLFGAKAETVGCEGECGAWVVKQCADGCLTDASLGLAEAKCCRMRVAQDDTNY